MSYPSWAEYRAKHPGAVRLGKYWMGLLQSCLVWFACEDKYSGTTLRQTDSSSCVLLSSDGCSGLMNWSRNITCSMKQLWTGPVRNTLTHQYRLIYWPPASRSVNIHTSFQKCMYCLQWVQINTFKTIQERSFSHLFWHLISTSSKIHFLPIKKKKNVITLHWINLPCGRASPPSNEPCILGMVPHNNVAV